LNIDTPRDLAYAIKAQAAPELSPRPWQQHSPNDTLWWLVPSSEWPAYRHGKFVFSFAKDGPRKALLGVNDPVIQTDKLFAGVNVEKGYGRLAAEVDPVLRRKSDQILDPGWLWYQLIEERGARRFAETLQIVSGNATLHLYVVSSYVHDRDTDAPRERDAILFDCSVTGISALLANGFPVGVLRGCDLATNFGQLARHLGQVDEYHWVDIYAGTYVTRGEQDVTNLHRDVLSHLRSWVVEAPKVPRK
jgi:hypothetical protein